MDWLLVTLGIIFLILGLVGCVFPALPGPPLAYVAIVLLKWHDKASPEISTALMVWLGVAVIVVTALDYVLPIWGTKRSGGSKAGRTGSMIGLIVGVFFGPVMIILGPFIGAILGELISGKDTTTALKSGWGAFLGFLYGTLAKLIVTGFIIYYFIGALT